MSWVGDENARSSGVDRRISGRLINWLDSRRNAELEESHNTMKSIHRVWSLQTVVLFPVDATSILASRHHIYEIRPVTL